MCGIIGSVDWSGHCPPDESILRRMLATIRHRGPDEFGLLVDKQVGIGCARLSIVDLTTGQQPIPNEDRSAWIVFNGEIYNHPELRVDLERAGHRFSTRSDTEVILHLYEDLGPACLNLLNGQFAIAIWDARKAELFLARDRLGVRPLFYTALPHGMVFGSEVKALLMDPRVQARLDPYALAQAFTFWAPLAPRTVFKDIAELPPGHYMQVRDGAITISRYWSLAFPAAGQEQAISLQAAAEQLRSLLADAARLRLRADVQVGSYLSGGLDSTLIAALIRECFPENLVTFSIAFEEQAFDERTFQELATDFLNTDHRRIECTNAAIGQIFPEVVWHVEAPLLRTSPAPMYLLSKLVHENGIKVVLTGEGADEFLGGYNIFKEDKVRRFWARRPESVLRPLLLKRLYPYIPNLSRTGTFFKTFFGEGLAHVDQLGYSHQIRWHNTARLQRFFSAALKAELGGYDPVGEWQDRLDGALAGWSHLAQAQATEVATFMSPYLLSSQGDRVMAANSIEGRFPFLDHRVVEFCNNLPPRLKILGLRDKLILRKCAQELLPPPIWQRRKQPYRAPIHTAFFAQPLEYMETLLAPQALHASGLFDPDAVALLARKCRAGGRITEGEDMALVGVLSTQLLYNLFVQDFSKSVPELAVRVVRTAEYLANN